MMVTIKRSNEVVKAWETYIDTLDPVNYKHLKHQINNEPNLKNDDKKYILDYAEDKLITLPKKTKGEKMVEFDEMKNLKEEIASLKRQLKRKDRKIEKLESDTKSPDEAKAAKMREVFEKTKIPKNFSVKRLAALHDNLIIVRGRYIRTSQLRISTDLHIDDICRLFTRMSKLDESQLELLRHSM